MSTSNFFLFVNPKWKGTEVYEALTKIQFRCFFDDSLQLLDFKINSVGFVYIQKLNLNPQSSSDYRKLLAQCQNNHPSLKIQALVDYSNKDLFNSIQEFSVVELKIQIIPIDNCSDLAQYIERYMLSETQEDKNPFNKDLTVNTNDQALTNQLFLNCLKNIPKIGEKNAQLVAKSYKNLKTLSNVPVDDLTSKFGVSSAKAIYDFFHNSQQ